MSLRIGPDGVIPLLLEAVPSFADAWDESENVDDGERLLYLDAGDFIRHLVRKHLANEVDEFQQRSPPSSASSLRATTTSGTSG